MGNTAEIKLLEQEAFLGMETPMSLCSTVANISSIKVHCREFYSNIPPSISN